MGRAQRIAYDARYVNDRYHGIGRCAFRLLEALVAAAPERTFVVLRGRGRNTRFDWSALERRPNVELWNGPWPLYGLQEHALWPLRLNQSRADLFHSPYFVAPLWSSRPVIITVHDLIFDRYPEYMPSAWARPYYRLLMRTSLRRAWRVLAVSRATASDLIELYGTPREKIVVTPNGVERNFGAVGAAEGQSMAALRQRYGLNRPFVLTVGTRRPHKNLARLIHAFAPLAGEAPHDLVLAGPADERFGDDARRAAEEAGLNGRVHFLDWVPENELPGLYKLADVVAVPSLMEGFGLPALEAMASGTPVLASNTSSLPEVVGEAGILVNPHDTDALRQALRYMLRDEQLRERLARAGAERAAQFTWERAACQVLKLYDAAREAAHD
jgi:glycosyltransferase involved in cell wall biosynthesis